MAGTWFPQASMEDSDIQRNAGNLIMSSPIDTYVARTEQTIDNSYFADAFHGAQGVYLQRDGSKMLSPEEATDAYGNGGLTKFDSPVSDDYAKFKSAQDARNDVYNDVLSRGGSAGASKSWLGFGLSMAVGILDPIQDGAAILS